ncbi:MAG: TonB-dependent receptor [Pseudomonadota bacterium]
MAFGKSAGSKTSSFIALLMCGAGTQALAQTQAQPAQAAPAVLPADQPQTPAVSDIIVTGSRIARKDFAAESPITTVGESTLKASGTPQLEETVNFMPQLSVASTGQSRQVNGPSPGAGRSTTNLRGLGTSRTLVLLDGRRLQPSDAFNVVDINSIPTNMIASVEIITGGASAVYGSDAISGVVNYKTKSKVRGFQLDADAGISELGDARYVNLSGLAGTSLGEDRNNAVLSVSYFNRGETRLGNRDFFTPSNITSRGPDGQVNSSGITQAALDALFITRYGLPRAPLPGDTLSVNPDGTLYSQGNASNTVNCKVHAGIGDNATYFTNTFLTPNECDATSNNSALLPLKRWTVFGKANYFLTDNMEIYGQFNFVDGETSQTQPGTNIANPRFLVSPTNVTIPADLRTLLAARANPNATFVYSVRTNKLGVQEFQQRSTTWQGLVGLRGELGIGDWTWDAFGAIGRTDAKQTANNYINTANFAALLIAADAGNSLCAGGWNLFNTQAPVSDACKAFIARNVDSRDVFEQQYGQVQLQGKLFKTWAGDVRAAVGVEYRRNAYTTTPDVQLQTLQLTSGGLSTTAPVLPGAGSQTVKEVFAEALIPLLSNSPVAEEFSVDLAYRHSDYDTSGPADTYKASVLWKVNSLILLRGSQQRAIRAPSVGELFTGQFSAAGQLGTVATGGGDPCSSLHPARTGASAAQVQALCIAQGVPSAAYATFVPTGSAFQQVSRGNPNLQPEKANSLTAGIVIRPASRLSFSLDYFNIEINNAIGSVSGPQQLQSCFNLNGQNPTYSATNPTCATIHRLNTGMIDSIDALSQNLFSYETAGWDAQLDWRVNLSPELGTLNFNLTVSKVTKYLIQKDISQPPVDFNGTVSGNNQAAISSSPADSESWSHPDLKAFASIGWSVKDLDLGVRLRYIGAMRDISTVANPASTVPGVNAVTYVDLNAGYKFNDRFSISAGIINALNKQPETTNGQPGLSEPNLYDRVGRRFFLTASVKFN